MPKKVIKSYPNELNFFPVIDHTYICVFRMSSKVVQHCKKNGKNQFFLTVHHGPQRHTEETLSYIMSVFRMSFRGVQLVCAL